MKTGTRLLLMILITILIVVVDHITKSLAVTLLKDAPPINLLGGVLRIAYSENAGGILSLGADWQPQIRFLLLTVAPGILFVIVPFVVVRRQQLTLLEVIWLSLFLAGGLSNWIDRVLNQGMVVDFMNLGIGGLRTGI